MSDNDPGDLRCRHNDDVPMWVCKIIDKHGITGRSHSPLQIASVLLNNAAILLQKVSLTVFREQALSDEARRQIAECKTMIDDAEKLYPLCPTHPGRSNATILPFGDRSPQ